MSQWTYFTDEEGAGLDKELMAMLDMARSKAGVPFIITCGLRTKEENAALPNSVSDSAHLTGHAVDLHCADSTTRKKMVKALFDAGFTRVILYKGDGHIHVDNDPTKPQDVMPIED